MNLSVSVEGMQTGFTLGDETCKIVLNGEIWPFFVTFETGNDPDRLEIWQNSLPVKNVLLSVTKPNS